LEKVLVDGRIILKLILKKQDGMAWTGFVWQDNEPSASIKSGEFFDQLERYQLFKKSSAPWDRVAEIFNIGACGLVS
jgi:hypothetical protein